jgi:hypothetical protein
MSDNNISLKVNSVSGIELNLSNIDQLLEKSKTISSIDDLGANIFSIFGGLTGVVSDTIKNYRAINGITLLKKYAEVTNSSKIVIEPDKIGSFYNILNFASLENDTNLQDKWAVLLANTLNKEDSFNKLYINLLSQLNEQEAKILDFIFDNTNELEFKSTFNRSQFPQNYVNSEELHIINMHLIGLGITKYVAPYGGIKINSGYGLVEDNNLIQFTDLAYNFIKACKIFKSSE